MGQTKRIRAEESKMKRKEIDEFLKAVLACDIKELYSLLVSASWCLRDLFNSTKKEEYLEKSEKLKEIYTKLYPYVFDL